MLLDGIIIFDAFVLGFILLCRDQLNMKMRLEKQLQVLQMFSCDLQPLVRLQCESVQIKVGLL